MELSAELRVVPLSQLCLQVDGTLPPVPPCRQVVPLPPPLALLCGRDAASLMRVASVQVLLETSFLHTGLKFTEVIGRIDGDMYA